MRRHRKELDKGRPRLPAGLKSAPLYGSVGEVWSAHEEAADPRKVLSQLKNRRKFPWKTLAFDLQPRPPYSGRFWRRRRRKGK